MSSWGPGCRLIASSAAGTVKGRTRPAVGGLATGTYTTALPRSSVKSSLSYRPPQGPVGVWCAILSVWSSSAMAAPYQATTSLWSIAAPIAAAVTASVARISTWLAGLAGWSSRRSEAAPPRGKRPARVGAFSAVAAATCTPRQASEKGGAPWYGGGHAMSITLPAPVQGYIGASNAFDGDPLIAWFADDALVNDRREFWGH